MIKYPAIKYEKVLPYPVPLGDDKVMAVETLQPVCQGIETPPFVKSWDIS